MFKSSNLPYWVLGIPFFKSHYTIFDNANKRIGFV